MTYKLVAAIEKKQNMFVFVVDARKSREIYRLIAYIPFRRSPSLRQDNMLLMIY